MAMAEMTEAKDFRRFLKTTLIAIAILFVVMMAGGLYFREEIQQFSQLVLDTLGFWPLGLFIYLADMSVSPFPPDLVLVLIANSSYSEQWYLYVTLVAFISTAGGFSSWWLGRFIARRPNAPKFLKDFSQRHRLTIEKHGALGVALGALTPLPFSLTCWSAGFVQLDLKRFALGAFVRIPRVYFYYWLIQAANF